MIKYSICERFSDGKKVLVKHDIRPKASDWDSFNNSFGAYKTITMCTEKEMDRFRSANNLTLAGVRLMLTRVDDSNYNNFALTSSNLACLYNSLHSYIDVTIEQKFKYHIEIEMDNDIVAYETDDINEKEKDEMMRPLYLAYGKSKVNVRIES